ncbi:salicylate hydroxylase [Hypoxylon cercidicola]|nr:salicylate hydroxylase [Hypoxylon cercidicola]
MAEETHASSLKLAIIGGGLAGVTLGNALIQHQHIEFHIYESALEFSERGAAVGLATNAQRALYRVLPQADATLERAGGVSMNSSRVMVGEGPSMGNMVFDLAGTDPGIVIHRASLLRELLADLPKEALHANKKLSGISERGDSMVGGGVEVSFTDGTTAYFDAVVGADGIFSAVRDYVLREFQDPENEFKASPSGFWDCRNLVPFEKAKETLGEQYFELDRQYGWVTDGALLMHDVLENRTTVQCVVSAIEEDSPKDRKRPLSREFLEKALGSSLESTHTRGMIDLILDQPSPHGYSQWEHKATPAYASGRVCIIGDAAHATTPWQGSGAGLAIEDAMVLGKLLGAVTSAGEISAAMEAFSDVRRPRCQRVIDSSRGTARILCGKHPEAGLDPDRLKETLMPRWNHIYGIDHEKHESDALQKFEQILQGRK